MNDDDNLVALYKFDWDYGRCGNLSGLFIAQRHEVANLYGKTIYFGEVLGKHSEIEVEIDEDARFEEVTTDRDKIQWLLDTFKSNTICGHNPFDYEESDEDEEDYDEDE